MRITNLIIAIFVILLNLYFATISIDLLKQNYALAERGVQGTDMMAIRFPLTMTLIFHVFIISSIIVLFPKFHKNIVLLVLNGLGFLWAIGLVFLFHF